jgi:hypothetical protein
VCAEVEATVFENGRAAVERGTARGVTDRRRRPRRGGRIRSSRPPLADALVNGHLVRYDHIGHFGPLQDPWTIARD